MKRPTARSIAKVLGTSLAAVLILLWCFTMCFFAMWITPNHLMSVYGGAIHLSSPLNGNHFPPSPMSCEWSPSAPSERYYRGEVTRTIDWITEPPFDLQGRTHTFDSCFPLWIPSLAVALPTFLLWLPDIRARRRRPGLCPCCLYDRRGLTPESLCPECGKPPQAPPSLVEQCAHSNARSDTQKPRPIS